MISLEEIDGIAREILGDYCTSVKQINLVTIRIKLANGFIDIFQSLKDSTKYAFHIEFLDGRIFRLDCRPERKYKRLKSFPWHFHNKTEENVIVSPFSNRKSTALRQFLKFAKKEVLY